MKDELLEKAEQIVKPLKWGYPKTPNAGFICRAKTLFAEYEAKKDGSKYKVTYTNTAEGEPAKDATGWLTEEDAKYWTYTNHCKKVLPMLSFDSDQWISVDDELPKKHGEYLVYLKEGYQSIDEYFMCASCDTWCYYNGHDGNNVTHWMPLPPPPIEVSND